MRCGTLSENFNGRRDSGNCWPANAVDDLSIIVPGGHFSLSRTYVDGRWTFSHDQKIKTNLGVNGHVRRLNYGGVDFESRDTVGNVFANGASRIMKESWRVSLAKERWLLDRCVCRGPDRRQRTSRPDDRAVCLQCDRSAPARD